MAEHLLRAGHRLRLYARHPEATAPLLALGAAAFSSPAVAPGFAGSRMLDLMGPKMAKRDFSAGIEARLHEKDFRMVLGIAGEAGIELPAVTLVAKQLRILMEAGWGYDDTSSLLRVLEAQQGREVES